MNQHEFIQLCTSKYELEHIPNGERWEDAHYPNPQCLGGTTTLKLWGRDHSLQGVLQSEELNHPCLHHASENRDRENIELYYPKYLPLFEKWIKRLKSAGGKSCIEKLGGSIPTPNGNPSHLNGGNIKKVHERRKTDPEFDLYMKNHAKANGAKGGAVSGPSNRGRRWCNNGISEKRYTEVNGLPEGFKPGRLPHKNGR
jgi:hypothetical protein